MVISLLTYLFVVVASFWAFIVCGGFLLATVLPIIAIIQIFDNKSSSDILVKSSSNVNP